MTVLQGVFLTCISTKDERDGGDGSKCLDMSVRGGSSPMQTLKGRLLEKKGIWRRCFKKS